MKHDKLTNQKYSPEEISEAIVFPGTKDKASREAVLSELRDFRQRISNKQTARNKKISQLLQLRFLLEDYVNSGQYNKNYFFGYFLKEYITRVEKKNKEFAEEIDVDPTELSQIINRHRNPTEKLIIRLEIHSNKNFPALIWLRLLEKDRAYALIHDKAIIEKEKKHVKEVLDFSF